MNFKARLEIGQQLLLQKRIPGVEHANNLHVLLRLFGVPIPPPYFCSFAFNVVFYCIAYAASLCALITIGSMVASGSLPVGVSVNAALTLIMVGAMLGIFKSVEYERKKQKYDLPKWEELHRLPDVFD